MKLGLQLGYWGAQPPEGVGELVDGGGGGRVRRGLHRGGVGLRRVHAAGLVGQPRPRDVRLGTSIVQMSGRTPTSIAMHTLTLDHLTDGRVILGIGVSGPQVVEGWYGQPVREAARPHPRGTSTSSARCSPARRR